MRYMPFTLSHPAAVVPLRRLMGGYGVMSALVIGSMVPDLPYFLQPLLMHFGWELTSQFSHSATGLLLFNIPAATGVYLLYRLILRRPMLSLLPAGVARPLVAPSPGPSTPLWALGVAVPLCVTIGALTHLAWDGCTHEKGPFVQLLPILQTQVAPSDHLQFGFYRVVQHLSSLGGLAVMAWWGWRWLRREGLLVRPLESLRMTTRQCWAVGTLLLASVASTLVLGLSGLPWPPTLHDVRLTAYRLGGGSVASLGTTLLAYGIAWQCVRFLGLAAAAGPRRREASALGGNATGGNHRTPAVAAEA